MMNVWAGYCLVACVCWVVQVIQLLSQALDETLTLGKCVIHGIGILVPLLSPITIWLT